MRGPPSCMVKRAQSAPFVSVTWLISVRRGPRSLPVSQSPPEPESRSPPEQPHDHEQPGRNHTGSKGNSFHALAPPHHQDPTFALSGHSERHHTLSTQQIPSTAQIAAARAALWHQNTPEPAGSSDVRSSLLAEPSAEPSPETKKPSDSPAEAAALPSAEPTSDAVPEQAPSDLVPSPANEEGAASAEIASGQDHPGIDLSDPDDLSHPDVPRLDHAPSAPSPAVALLTQSAAREFLNRTGLLLFAAKPQFAGVPAPTFVEATLGVANGNPSLAATQAARTLLARLVADGSAVPLNLLGLPSTTAEAPDFIASAAAFPYIFTLRGDKAWKQPPATSGAMKVSPLAANTYTLLTDNGPQASGLSAYDLVGLLGKEVTEAAVLRALSELWQQLRVLPVPQPGNKPTVWEPITTRFTKQIKTGANAGQPTALSTFISLYLGQSILATEDEIETFLSPLAPRSRVRDVLHALSGARQLETITIEGKHNLHIAGDLPIFASAKATQEPDEMPILSEDGSRIKKFVPKPRKLGTGSADRPKPFRAPSDRSRPDRDPARRSDARPAKDRFAASSARPTFNKPWDEEKQARTDRAAAAPAASQDGSISGYQDIDLDAGTRPAPPRRAPSVGNKPAFGRKPGFGDRPRFGGDRPAFNRDRPSGDRPAFSRDRPAFNRDRPSFDRAPREGGPREGGSDRFQPRDARRDFTPHPSAGGDARPPRHFGNKPSSGGKPSFPRKPFDPERSAGDRERRPFRRDDTGPPRENPRPQRRDFDSGGSDRPFAGRPRFSRDRDTESGNGRPPFRKFDAPRTPRPPREGDDSRPPRRPSGDRPAPRSGGFGGGSKPFGSRPFPRREGSDAAPRREGFTPRDGGSSFPRREGSFPPRREGGFAGKRDGGFAGKREGGFAAKKPFSARPAAGGTGKPFKKPSSRSSPDAPGASTFDKFKGNAKPWGKRPPARKYKPKEDEA